MQAIVARARARARANYVGKNACFPLQYLLHHENKRGGEKRVGKVSLFYM